LSQPADEGPACASALWRGGGEARLSSLHTALGAFYTSLCEHRGTANERVRVLRLLLELRLRAVRQGLAPGLHPAGRAQAPNVRAAHRSARAARRARQG